MQHMFRAVFGALYRVVIKPILFWRSPDPVHDAMVRTGKIVGKYSLIMNVTHALLAHPNDARLAQTVFGIPFRNPLGLSAGLDKNAVLPPVMQAIGFGFATVGTITALPAPGNPRPWFYRLPQTKSIVVNAGLPNEGAAKIHERILSFKSSLFEDFPLVASVGKTNIAATNTDEAGLKDYIEGLKTLKDNPHVALFEINISCPNTFGGEPFTRPKPLEALLSDIDSLQLTQPITIKMPINLTWDDFDALLQIITRHNVAGVTIGNLQKDRTATELKDNLSDSIQGNLSGKPTEVMCNELITKTYQKYGDNLVIIGVGGVFTAEDAYEKIKRGATLVDMITGVIFGGPTIIGDINTKLAQLLAADGYTNVSQAIGAYYREKK